MSSRLIYSGCGCEVIEHFPDYCPTCRLAELETVEIAHAGAIIQLTEENQRLKEQLQTLIDMHSNGDRQGIIETLEALYTGVDR